MKHIALALITLSLFACTDKKTRLFDQIKELERSEKLGTEEGLAELAGLHETYGMTYTDSLANTYLYAAAMYHFFNEDQGKAKQLFELFTERGDSSIRDRNARFNLGDIAAKEGVYDSVDYWMESVLDDYKLTTQQWSDLITIYESKTGAEPAKTISDFDKLSKAYWALGTFDKTLEYLDKGIAQNPTDSLAAVFMYRGGFVAWEYLKDAGKAQAYYEAYLQAAPSGEYAEEVRTILESGMLGMSDEDILEMLKAGS